MLLVCPSVHSFVRNIFWKMDDRMTRMTLMIQLTQLTQMTQMTQMTQITRMTQMIRMTWMTQIIWIISVQNFLDFGPCHFPHLEILGFWTGSFSTLGRTVVWNLPPFYLWLTCLLVRVWSQLSPPSPLVITDQLISWSHLAFPRLNRRRNVIGGRGVTFTQEKFLHFKILKN